MAAEGGRRIVDYDVVVVGGGLAGLVAAARAAEAGARVGVVTLSPGNLGLWSGLVHGRSADGARGEGSACGPALRFFADFSRRAGLPFGPPDARAGEESLLLLSASGRPGQCVLAPESAAAGHVPGWAGPRGGRVGLLVAGFTELGDYPASLIAASARRETGVTAAHRSMSLGGTVGRASALRIAYLFDDRTWFQGFLDSARRVFGRDAAVARAVAFPPVLGQVRFRENINSLEDCLGARVFELPALPPSVPGRRFFHFWRHRLEYDGRTTFHGGVRVTSAESRGDRCVSVSDGLRIYRAKAFVLATGGVAGGGLEVTPGAFFTLSAVRGASSTAGAPAVPDTPGTPRAPTEALFGLATEGAGTDWLSWGVRTDPDGRPRPAGDPDRVLTNVFVAGWQLPGADAGALGSIITGWRAGGAAAAQAWEEDRH